MKSILLAFGFLIVSCPAVFPQATAQAQVSAQAQPAAAAGAISKSDFNAKVGELNARIDQNKSDEAKEKWTELHKMMLSEFALLKSKIMTATQENNETAKDSYMAILQKQTVVYYQVVKFRDNLIANKGPLNEKLNEYIALVL